MDLLAAWLLYPLALGALCLGLGLLIERLADWRMPGALLLPAGFATLLALVRVITEFSELAKLALPAVIVLALAGMALSVQRLRALHPDPWCVLAVVGVFAVFAGPVVLSGEPTFAGYRALPDTGHQLSLSYLYADRGPDWMSLPPGSMRETTAKYVVTAYPVAGQATLGVTAPLGVIDLAWLYQPLLTFMALIGALALWSLTTPLGRSWQRGVATFVAGQSALVLGNVLLGTIKEFGGLTLLLTVVALVAAALREQRPARSLLPVGLAAAAALGAVGPAAIPYLAAPGLVVLGVWGLRIARERRLGDALWLAAGGAVTVALAWPVLRTLRTSIDVGTSVLVDLKAVIGHLAGPLETVQALGIWLSGDFRYTGQETSQNVLLWIAGISALLGLAWAIRRRHWGVLLLAAAFIPTSIYLLQRGTTYADAKVLILVSPACLLLAMLGAMSLWNGRLRPLSALVAVAIAGGVVASNALAYHDVSLAPYERYAELVRLNDELAGRGPVFFGEYDEFAGYFLRRAAVFSAPEGQVSFRHGPYEPNALNDPLRRPSEKTPIDIDDVTLTYLQSFPYIVLRRGPVTSRPPANFVLHERLRFYDVWRRTPRPRVLSHKPLGPDVLNPAAPVSARTARAWGRRARALSGRIAFVERERAPLVLAARAPNRPLRWSDFSLYPEASLTNGPANIRLPLPITRAGRYHAWVEGSFARRIAIYVDGRRLPHTPSGLNNPGGYASLGELRLPRGTHEVRIRQRGGDLRPGSGGFRSSLRHIGPLFFDPVANARFAVRTIDARDWRSLIGVNADWLEIVSRVQR